jgi:hypothetical protein
MRFITMMGTAALTMTAATYADLKLNEIRTGTGNNEYIEIKGNPGESLAGVTAIIIGDGTSTGTAITKTGVVEWIYRFAATDVIGSNGYLVLHNPGQNPANAADTTGLWSLTVAAGATDLPWGYQASGLSADTQIESPDNMTFMLVRNFTGTDTFQTRAPNSGAGGQDLDTNDDGVLDITPWSAILDSVAFKETNGSTPAANQDWWYSANTCGPYVSRTVVSATTGTVVAAWDFQTTTTGGTAVATADTAQPRVFTANFGTGTFYADGTTGSSSWVSAATATRELNAFGGTAVNATGGRSQVLSEVACRWASTSRHLHEPTRRGQKQSRGSTMTPRDRLFALVDEAASSHMCAPARIMARGGCAEINEARRWIYCRLAEAGWSYRRIGRAMGRDHRAVMRAMSAVR